VTNGPRTVLAVDDTPENLDLLKAILAPHYKVKVAINGEAALRLAAAAPPDIILLDVMMPGLDGYAVCARLKEDAATSAIPVILVSAVSEAMDDGRGFAAGAADYITKPASGPVVLARVRTHLALARLTAAASDAVALIEAGDGPAANARLAAALQGDRP
jgi:putative two-component system response regulator